MKEIIRNIKSRDEISENSRDIKKLMEIHRFKKLILIYQNGCNYCSGL